MEVSAGSCTAADKAPLGATATPSLDEILQCRLSRRQNHRLSTPSSTWCGHVFDSCCPRRFSPSMSHSPIDSVSFLVEVSIPKQGRFSNQDSQALAGAHKGRCEGR